MRTKPRLAVGVWLVAVAACIVVVARSRLDTNMAAFLPRTASAAQQVLTEQVRNGVAARLVLLGIEDAPPSILAELSQSLAKRLREESAFLDVENGDAAALARTREFFWHNRYLLSPDVTAERFTTAGLHAALEGDLGLLGSDMGALVESSLPQDPTGEALTLLGRFAGTKGPTSRDGVWFSASARRALLLVHTRAAGFDVDAQQRDLARVAEAFERSRQAVSGAESARLVESGPGAFAVRTRDTMKRDATRLSLLASAVAAGLLLFAYRSPLVLALGLLPVASGALAAFAAVSLGFGFVHGVTLGFGVTLIGESVDYAIYLFTQTGRGDSATDTLARIWPTLRLGALTSIVGFSAMLFSGFVGFAQIGLFSITGLVAAAGVTRFVLPQLVPDTFFAAGAAWLGRPLLSAIRQRVILRPAIGVLVVLAAMILVTHHGGFWDENLANLSPIPAAAQRLDATLRHDLAVPDFRYFVVLQTADEQRALSESDVLALTLDPLVKARALGGFDVPSEILPSDATQQQRRAALPDVDTLRARFSQALEGLPFRATTFEPFFRDVAAAKAAPTLTRAALPPPLRLQLDSMLFKRGTEWNVVVPLRGVSDPGRVAAAIDASGLPGASFVDLNRETALLLHTFQHEATLLAVIGSLAIIALLFVGLRSPMRVLTVIAPLAASVIVTAAVLTIGGGKLSIFMVVGFLLIVAVGSNYCLFFERPYHDADAHSRSVASIILANLCTVSAYGLMAISGIPVLHDIGMTVAIGTFLSLFFAAVLSTRRSTAEISTARQIERQRAAPGE